MKLVLVLFVSLFLSFGSATDCPKWQTPKYNSAYADVVFHGKVTTIKRTSQLWQVDDPNRFVHFVTFEISALWKGPKSKTIEVVTGWPISESFALPLLGDEDEEEVIFQIGKTYVVYAKEDKRRDGSKYYYTTSCHGSRLILEDQDNLLDAMTGEPPVWRP